jgi:hypothetical protein
MTTKRIPRLDLARGVRLLLSLRDSLDQSRARGLSLAEAKRRLAKRLAAEGSVGRK